MTLPTELRDFARQAAREAYCPYSKFHVGAAVTGGERVFLGFNIENASYGLTVCAERVAIFNMLAGGVRQFKQLAVSCPDAAEGNPAAYRMPCGACRQVMAEFAAPKATILIDGVGLFELEALLPNAFRLH